MHPSAFGVKLVAEVEYETLEATLKARNHRNEGAGILPALQPDVSVTGQTTRAAMPEL
jgi:hypothetical protein